jgi:hypothetical protein
MQECDCISQRTVTTEYHYQEGCYDFVERKFIGFAVVEQVVSETIFSLSYQTVTSQKSFYYIDPFRDTMKHYFWHSDPSACHMEESVLLAVSDE